MRVIVILAVFSLPFSVGAQQQDHHYIPYRKGNRWGFCDSAKNILVKPAYDKVNWMQVFSIDRDHSIRKVAIAMQKGKFGLIDQQGRKLTDFIYSDVASYQPDSLRRKAILLALKNSVYIFYPETGKTLPASKDLLAYFGDARLIEARIDCALTTAALNITETAPGIFLLRKNMTGKTDGKEWASFNFFAEQVRNTECSNEFFYFKRNGGWGAAEIIVPPGNKYQLSDSIHVQPVYDSIKRVGSFNNFFVRKGNEWYFIRDIYKQMPDGQTLKKRQTLGPYEGIRDDVDEARVGLSVKKGGKWGIILDNEGTLALIDQNKYSKYYYDSEKKLIAVYNEKQQLVGYCHINGTKFWD